MYDQLGGGFHRYSVDAHWLVPHFEKMLYDNAQLASLYLHAWLAFGDPECRRICEETLDYVLREMTDPGRRLLLRPGRRLRGRRGQVLRLDAGRDPRGARRPTPSARSALLGCRPRPATSRARASSTWPASPIAERDRAAAAAGSTRRASSACTRAATTRCWRRWNGLACRALRRGRPRARPAPTTSPAAVRNAEFLLERDAARRAAAADLEGAARRELNGYLEDYAMVAAALVDVYEATFERRWLDEARGLADDMIDLFWDDALEGFYDTGQRPRAADRPAAQPLRQRDAVRHLGRDRDAAAPGGAHRRGDATRRAR